MPIVRRFYFNKQRQQRESLKNVALLNNNCEPISKENGVSGGYFFQFEIRLWIDNDVTLGFYSLPWANIESSILPRFETMQCASLAINVPKPRTIQYLHTVMFLIGCSLLIKQIFYVPDENIIQSTWSQGNTNRHSIK